MQAGFKLGLPVSNPVWYLVILIILQFRMCTRKNFDVLNLPVSNLIWYLVSNLIWYLVIYNNTNHNAFVGQERFGKALGYSRTLAALVPRIHLEAFPKSFLTSKSMWLVYSCSKHSSVMFWTIQGYNTRLIHQNAFCVRQRQTEQSLTKETTAATSVPTHSISIAQKKNFQKPFCTANATL